ncbi:helix-turn-helix transcriptional regulator, partial [Buttiauxella sp. S19-1]|uniref:helix-turn-helix transcriptional regulator n=1 Tax=Buttiauxella sp. S19-1 TaxID=941430 RepID=UPI001EDC39D2
IILLSDVFQSNIFHDKVPMYILPTSTRINAIIGISNNKSTRGKFSHISLSSSERNLLRNFWKYGTAVSISSVTGVSQKTVSSQKLNSLRKMGLKNKHELMKVILQTQNIHNVL